MDQWSSKEGHNKFVTKRIIYNPDGSEVRVSEKQMPTFHNQGRTELRVTGLFPNLKTDMKSGAINPDEAQEIIDKTKPELKEQVKQKLIKLFSEEK